MAVKINPVLPGLYIIPGLVNEYVLETADGDVLIDTGFPGSTDKILSALKMIGKTPQDIKHILLTHAHPDHIGSAAALKQATGASVYAHAIAAPLIEGTAPRRAGHAAPGFRKGGTDEGGPSGDCGGRAAIRQRRCGHPCAGALRRPGGPAVEEAWRRAVHGG